MKVIVYLLGFGHIVLCSYLILNTIKSVDVLKGLYIQYGLKYLAAIPALYGILFIISASASVYPWLFIIIGLLGICEAIIAFTNPQKIYDRILDWYFKSISEPLQRLFGIAGIIFGTLLLTWTK
jgi:hypothetical protein